MMNSSGFHVIQLHMQTPSASRGMLCEMTCKQIRYFPVVYILHVKIQIRYNCITVQYIIGETLAAMTNTAFLGRRKYVF